MSGSASRITPADDRERPMALYQFHRVLIAATIVFFGGFAWWAIRVGGGFHVAMGVGSALIAGLAGAYLVYFNHRLRRLSSAVNRRERGG
jgi:hypothetical protein